MTAFFVAGVIGWFVKYFNTLLNICFNLRWQVKFQRCSNKNAGWQAKKRAGSMKKGRRKNIGARG